MPVLLAVVGGFCCGIFARSLLFSGPYPVLFLALMFSLVACAALLQPRRSYMLLAMFLACSILGALRFAASESLLQSAFAPELNRRVSYDGVVVGDPDLRDANQRVAIRITSGDVSTIALAVMPRATALTVGERVHVSGTLALPEPFSGDNGRTFRYDKYLERDGIRVMLNYASARVTGPPPWYSVPAALARAKHAFIDGLASAMPEPYASLAGGIVIGGKSGLGTELQDAFTKSGLVQIIVLSGYNVMVVAEWMMKLATLAFARARHARMYTAVSGAAALLLFVGIAGFSATAVRAMLMALIALYARATGKSYVASRALLVTVFLMLLWNPLYLAFDPGFALSVVATAGLIWLASPIESRLPLKSTFWKDAIATTLAAQVAVLPLLLYFTGNLSFVSVPANLIAMPVMPVAMGYAALAGFGGMLFGHAAPVLAFLIGLPSYLISAYLIALANASAALPWAARIIPSFPFWAVVLAYAALAAISKRFSGTAQFTFARKAST